MKSFHVCPLDITHWEGKLEGDSGSKLEGDSGSKLEGDSASQLEGDSGSGSKLEGDSGSKLEGVLLLVGRGDGDKLDLDTSSENMNSFAVLLLHHRGLFYERPMNVLTSLYI